MSFRPMGDIQFGVYERPEHGDFALYASILNAAGQREHVAAPAVFVPHEPMLGCKPMMELHHRAAQQLMDSLWACGLRPTNGEGNAGQLGATERHLDDMRKIAFAKIGVEP